MNCKRIKKIILTDYIDGNLKGRVLEKIELHLRSCPSCHALAQDLRTTGKLFRTVSQREVPNGVWHKILAEINAMPVRRSFPETVLLYVQDHLSYLKPAVIMTSAAVLLLFALTVARLMPYKDYLKTTVAQDDILAISYNGDEEDGSEYDFGTPAEMFFL